MTAPHIAERPDADPFDMPIKPPAIYVALDPDTHKRLRIYAVTHDKSIAELIREAVAEILAE